VLDEMFALARGKIIQPPNFFRGFSGEQRIKQMRANEIGAAGDQMRQG
jgi:hypothetical protein